MRRTAALAAMLLLPACEHIGVKIDYSPVDLAPSGTPVAHMASGMRGGVVFIEAINGRSMGSPVAGREYVVPAGFVEVRMRYQVGGASSTLALIQGFEADRYYKIEATPDFDSRKVSFEITAVTRAEFKRFQCETQRKIQESLKNINPQKAPACDELPGS